MDKSNDITSDFINRLAMELQKVLPSENEQKVFVENIASTFATSPSHKYSDDFYFDIIKPAISALIRLREDSAKNLQFFKELVVEKQCSNEGTEYALEIFDGFIEMIDDILLDYDVQSFRCEDLKFNPLRQNVVKKLQADTPEQFKMVAESLAEGYERKGNIISKERVVAYSTELNSTAVKEDN